MAAAWAAPAAASVLYRCVGAQGELAYVSHTAGYRDCTRIGQWHARTAHAVPVSQRVGTAAHKPVAATVLPGKPPRPVAANPAVLKVTPLGDDNTNRVAPPPVAWQPVPVVVLDQLGSWILPRLLDADRAPAPSAAPAPAPAATQAPRASSRPAAAIRVTAPPPRHGAVYRVVEKNGTVLYTNVKALAQGSNAKMLFTYIVECYACDVHSHINWDTVPLHLAAYRGDVAAAAKLTGVDAALLRAVIHAESGFNPRALSYKGAQGLMQLMPATAFELGVGNAFDPAENISGGARYLAELLQDFHGDVKLAAAAYNAGAGAVTKYGGVPPYAETRVYVKRVALLYQRYRKALASRGNPALAAAAAD
ncbi:MAG: lytic transglycosylase domain-containing protein [Rhodanobacteraceae bacterium]|nr:MAG: lytic transglycosylase domain-containing protein [Rhodanobacteraceae bacterium]